MSRDEYANFVEDTIQLVIQQFVEKKIDVRIHNY